MAFSKKLFNATENLRNAYENGIGSIEYKTARTEWLKVFAEVAIEIGEPAIAWENPYDNIIEAIDFNANPEWIAQMLDEYEEMVNCLESIGYYAAQYWRDGYEECKTAFNC